MKLGIVIIHYNTSADLGRCLESLVAYPPTEAYEIVVVDNASVDEGLADVQRRFPQCQWILNHDNVGYARGCNRGIAAIEADYYLVLNPDIVVQPGALDNLLRYADRHPRAGMVGPQLLNEDGSVQHSCRRFYTLKTLLLRRTILGRIFPDSVTVQRHLMQDFDHQTTRPVDWVLGGCLLVRATAMARTGPMDERFFLYFEDVDWCYRMWQAGFEVQYLPEARFVHRHRRASAQGRFSRSFWLHLGSLISFYEKWGMLVWLLKKWRDPLLMLWWWALDLVGLTVAFWGAYALRSVMGGLFAEPLFGPGEYLPLLGFAALLASATFWLTGRYRPEGLAQKRPLGEHIRQIGIVGVLLLASTYLGHQAAISRAVLLMFIPLLAVATAVGGHVFRSLMRKLERGHLSLERTLLVGAPGRVQEWLGTAHHMSRQGVDIAGYLADGTQDSQLPALAGGEVPWLGCRADMLAVVRRYRISQVVFWDSPAAGSREAWLVLASLRRLRVRLRWHGGDAWLLATGARAEMFGQELSAVQSASTGLIFHVIFDRLLAVVAGALLGLFGAGPWLWLRSVRLPRGTAQRVTVPTSDLWGHNPKLVVVFDQRGRVLPLLWQWALAGALWKGQLAVLGPRPAVNGAVEVPREPEEVLDFWRREPRTPGLAGAWSVPPSRSGIGRVLAVLGALWRRPGGFAEIEDACDNDEMDPPAAGHFSGSG